MKCNQISCWCEFHSVEFYFAPILTESVFMICFLMHIFLQVSFCDKVVQSTCRVPRGDLYEKVEDACCLAWGYKPRILISLKVLITKLHHFYLSKYLLWCS